MANTTPRFRPGTTFMTRGRQQRLCTVTDVLTTTNLAGDVVAVRYVATHEFCGQTLVESDVLETTIAMGLQNAKTWLFNWKGGDGYNTVRATTREEAEVAAGSMGNGKSLVADLSTLRVATDADVAAEEKRFSGMFN